MVVYDAPGGDPVHRGILFDIVLFRQSLLWNLRLKSRCGLGRQQSKSCAVNASGAEREQIQEALRPSRPLRWVWRCLSSPFSMINLVNTLITNILSKKQELAMLESIGMSRRQIRQMVLGEGMLLAAEIYSSH